MSESALALYKKRAMSGTIDRGPAHSQRVRDARADTTGSASRWPLSCSERA